MQLGGGQQPLQGLLVYHLIVILGHQRVGKDGYLAEQGLVAAAGVELDDEVAALYACQRGVAVGAQQQADVLGVVGGFLVAYVEAVEQSFQLVALLEVAADGDLAPHADGERLIRELQTVEVGMVQVGQDGGLQMQVLAPPPPCRASFLHERIDADGTVKQVVAAADDGL